MSNFIGPRASRRARSRPAAPPAGRSRSAWPPTSIATQIDVTSGTSTSPPSAAIDSRWFAGLALDRPDRADRLVHRPWPPRSQSARSGRTRPSGSGCSARLRHPQLDATQQLGVVHRVDALERQQPAARCATRRRRWSPRAGTPSRSIHSVAPGANRSSGKSVSGCTITAPRWPCVRAMRPDQHEVVPGVGHGAYSGSRISSSPGCRGGAPSPPPACAAPRRSGPAGRSPCRRRLARPSARPSSCRACARLGHLRPCRARRPARARRPPRPLPTVAGHVTPQPQAQPPRRLTRQQRAHRVGRARALRRASSSRARDRARASRASCRG